MALPTTQRHTVYSGWDLIQEFGTIAYLPPSWECKPFLKRFILCFHHPLQHSCEVSIGPNWPPLPPPEKQITLFGDSESAVVSVLDRCAIQCLHVFRKFWGRHVFMYISEPANCRKSWASYGVRILNRDVTPNPFCCAIQFVYLHHQY